MSTITKEGGGGRGGVKEEGFSYTVGVIESVVDGEVYMVCSYDCILLIYHNNVNAGY